jgi:hypothetical protein
MGKGAREMTLLQFYRDWLEWAENDGTKGVFDGQYGLCYNLQRWCEADGSHSLVMQLDDEFRAAGLSVNYPFGRVLYVRLQNGGKLHTQRARLNWVKKRILFLNQGK